MQLKKNMSKKNVKQKTKYLNLLKQVRDLKTIFMSAFYLSRWWGHSHSIENLEIRECRLIFYMMSKQFYISVATKNYNVKTDRRKANSLQMKCHWRSTIPSIRITLPRNCDQSISDLFTKLKFWCSQPSANHFSQRFFLMTYHSTEIFFSST